MDSENNEETGKILKDQNTGTNAKIKKFDLDESYVENALSQIKEMVKGNQIDPESIKVESCEGEIIHFIAETRLNITTRISKKTMPGRIKGPVQVASEADCNEAFSKEYLTLFADQNMQKEIRNIVLKRDDKGFAQKDLVFQIPTWKKEFVVFEPCGYCRSKGTIQCKKCHGKGIDRCNKCHGTSTIQCTSCNGSCMVQGPQGNTVQCNKCHGQGKIGCTKCMQSGTVQCKKCASKGVTQCTNCQGNAFSSHITIVELEGRCEFNYPAEKLPNKVVALIEEYGEKIKEHASIELLDAQNVEVIDEEGEDERDAKHKILKLPIFYNVILPYGHIEFNFNDKTYYTFLFGKQALHSHVSPFMDDLLENGLRKINDAAENRGSVIENLAQAAKYKTLRQAMVLSANMPIRKALTKLSERYPYGFKDETVKGALMNTIKSYQSITKRSVTTGMAAASALSAALVLCYFALPFRGLIANKVPNFSVMGVIDLLALGLIIFLGNTIIKEFAASSLSKALKRIMPKQNFRPKATSLGNAPLINALLSALIFLAVIEASRHMPINTPSWYLSLLP